MAKDAAPAMAERGFMPTGPAGTAAGLTAGSTVTPVQGPAKPRKLVKNGSISLETRELAALEAGATGLVEGLGGYVSSTDRSETSLNMVLRVPQSSFRAALDAAGALGRLTGKTETAEDVSLQYADLEARVAAKRILKERYTSYLKSAKNVEDLLAVERSLNDVLSELDSIEAQFRALSDQVDYSSIRLYAVLPAEALPASQRSFAGGLARVWDAFLGFLHFLGYAAVALVLFGPPLILGLGLLYFVCFGKLGLVKKFFRLLSGRKTAPRGGA
jgi:hypothetical protein